MRGWNGGPAESVSWPMLWRLPSWRPLDARGGARTTAGFLLEDFEAAVRDNAGILIEVFEAAVNGLGDPWVLHGSLVDACPDCITVGSSIWLPTDRDRVWKGCREAPTAAADPAAAAAALLKALEKAIDGAAGPRGGARASSGPLPVAL